MVRIMGGILILGGFLEQEIGKRANLKTGIYHQI
jgi:hypothetical protein